MEFLRFTSNVIHVVPDDSEAAARLEDERQDAAEVQEMVQNQIHRV